MADQGSRSGTRKSSIQFRMLYGEKNDYNKAFPLITKSAEQGYAPAQSLLGQCYYQGEVIKQDKILGKKWLKKAAAQGDKNAIEYMKVNNIK